MINTSFNVAGSNWWAPGVGSTGGAVNAPANPFANVSGNNMAPAGLRNSLLGLIQTADLLSQSLRYMQGIGSRNAGTPFQNQRPVSGNTDVLQIVSSGTNRLAQRDMTVDVQQIAQGQRNEGTARTATQNAREAGFTAGSHHLGIQIGERTFDISFTVSATDTVQSVHQRIANLVNNRNIGVQASVVTTGTGANAQSQLVLESRETGANQQFTITESRVGNAATVLDIANRTQEAQDAVFRVNRGFTGALQTSDTNEVNLGFGVTATLHGTGEAAVSFERDEIGQINAFRHMVNSFNNMMTEARNAFGAGSRLERDLNQVLRGQTGALRRVGINVGADGRMSIDENRMAAAAERGDLERFVSRERVGTQSGFMNRLTRIADQAARNPASFTAPQTRSGFGGGLNPNLNARQMMQFNRFMNMGMLFDSMF